MIKSQIFRQILVVGLLIIASTILSKFSPTSETSPRPEPYVNNTNSHRDAKHVKISSHESDKDYPREVTETLKLIIKNGPFPYDKDGTVFQNRENRLPQKPRGYYREYTVKTPGSRDRGARRIVTGKGGEFYYTSDHYQTFEPIRPP